MGFSVSERSILLKLSLDYLSVDLSLICLSITEVAWILTTVQERLLEKEGDANISAINNKILKQKEENNANIEKYKILSEASANKELYTPEYIQYNTAKNLANNTKYYFR